ncbi:hypothetical protein OPQ81_011029 [Rhizoctonia solani]|nr:hypothetical protein OPQ81_011029 [Rhizoctonia solani]
MDVQMSSGCRSDLPYFVLPEACSGGLAAIGVPFLTPGRLNLERQIYRAAELDVGIDPVNHVALGSSKYLGLPILTAKLSNPSFASDTIFGFALFNIRNLAWSVRADQKPLGSGATTMGGPVNV